MIEFLKKLTIPEGYIFSKEEVKQLLEGDSPPNPDAKAPRKSLARAKEGPRYVKNVPATLTERSIHEPVFTNAKYRPGALLPLEAKKSSSHEPGITKLKQKQVKKVPEKAKAEKAPKKEPKKEKSLKKATVLKKEKAPREVKKPLKSVTASDTGTVSQEKRGKLSAKETKAPHMVPISQTNPCLDSESESSDFVPETQVIPPTQAASVGRTRRRGRTQATTSRNSTSSSSSGSSSRSSSSSSIAPSMDAEAQLDVGMQDQIPVSDLKTSSHFIMKGMITLQDFVKAQARDSFCMEIRNSQELKPGFVVKSNVLFFARNNTLRPVLPKALIAPLINTNTS